MRRPEWLWRVGALPPALPIALGTGLVTSRSLLRPITSSPEAAQGVKNVDQALKIRASLLEGTQPVF